MKILLTLLSTVAPFFQTPTTYIASDLPDYSAIGRHPFLIANKAKPHNIEEELIIHAVTEVLKSVVYYKTQRNNSGDINQQ